MQKVEDDFTCHEHALTHVPTSRHVAYRIPRRTSLWKPLHMHREISSHSSRVSHDSGEEVCAGLRTCTFRSLNFVTPAIDLPKPALMCRTSTVRPSNLDSEDAASRCGFARRRARFRCDRHSCSHLLRQHRRSHEPSKSVPATFVHISKHHNVPEPKSADGVDEIRCPRLRTSAAHESY